MFVLENWKLNALVHGLPETVNTCAVETSTKGLTISRACAVELPRSVDFVGNKEC